MRPIHLVPAGVVLLALGGIAAGAQFAGPAAPAASAAPGPGHAAMAPQQVAVTSAARACPPVQGGGSGQVAFIAGSPVASSSRPGEGQAELAPLPLAGAQLRTLNPISQTQPGLLSMLTTPPAQSTSKKAATVLQGWSVTATGTMAQTMEAEETTGAGLASVRCGEPGSDLWFVGPGQQGGAAQIQLDLMNVDTLPASVDVSIITDAGQVPADGDTGITVPPHQTVTEALSSLAGNASVVAIEVRTSIGRVAADVSESSSHGGTASWLPSTAPPSTQLVIPGVPPSGGTPGLYIVVPGSANARINVVSITSQGQHQPFGTQAVDLPGDSASYVPLTALGGTAALELTANVPVAAGVLVPGSGLGAFATATAPISEQAVVAGNTAGGHDRPVRARRPGPGPPDRDNRDSRHHQQSDCHGPERAYSHRAGHAAQGRQTRIRLRHRDHSAGRVGAAVRRPGRNPGPEHRRSIVPAISALTTIILPPARDSYDAISP